MIFFDSFDKFNLKRNIKMIEFEKKGELLLIVYMTGTNDNHWIYDNFNIYNHVSLKGTFIFDKKHVNNFIVDEITEEDYDKPIEFILGNLVGDYYKIDKDILLINHDVYIYKEVLIKINLFVLDNNISIFSKIDELMSEDIFISGNNLKSIPLAEFNNLIDNFPNSYEKKLYIQARLTTILRNYFDNVKDSVRTYNKYMNKKISRIGNNLVNSLMQNEIHKYSEILLKLKDMLLNENQYNEKQWQLEILQIILLLYPKYIYLFQNVEIFDIYTQKKKFLDYLLVDSTGNIDIIEIKRPFNNSIVTLNQYRDNYIPLRELSGAVMQIEKYIFYLNKWGKRGEDILTKRYEEFLPKNFNIRITNPGGFIIMGRENKLSKEQKQDFEVIKRKYKNIIDIITYDDLINRLEFTLKQLESSNNGLYEQK
ncbi:MAG: hypothetical protein HW421_1689 [Ignavibacteria bacterium]|nr:hypothetical protein [Ignavibacteria bacterium]